MNSLKYNCLTGGMEFLRQVNISFEKVAFTPQLRNLLRPSLGGWTLEMWWASSILWAQALNFSCSFKESF
jgi:hypothetical protein